MIRLIKGDTRSLDYSSYDSSRATQFRVQSLACSVPQSLSKGRPEPKAWRPIR